MREVHQHGETGAILVQIEQPCGLHHKLAALHALVAGYYLPCRVNKQGLGMCQNAVTRFCRADLASDGRLVRLRPECTGELHQLAQFHHGRLHTFSRWKGKNA